MNLLRFVVERLLNLNSRISNRSQFKQTSWAAKDLKQVMDMCIDVTLSYFRVVSGVIRCLHQLRMCLTHFCDLYCYRYVHCQERCSWQVHV